ncbi:MAG: response regulator transcription factor [Blastocatellia bacterium]
MSEPFCLSIVDDDDLVGRSLKRVIGSTAYRVDVFNSAEAFLDSDQLDECNCLILDVKMPGLSGLELQRQLQARNFDFPIIFMTSYVDDFSKAQALDAGAVDFLYKPFKEEQLFNAIDRAFNADKTLIAD